MGGNLAVVSNPGTGSIFTLTLPLVVCGPPSDHEGALDGEPTSSRLRILVAEDNRVNQTLIRRLLERAGHEVELAENGKEAVERAPMGWDLILMDMQMPLIDGLEATRQIRRALGPNLPIVALTANASAEDRMRCAEARMNGFSSKPFRFEDLREVLSRVRRPSA